METMFTGLLFFNYLKRKTKVSGKNIFQVFRFSGMILKSTFLFVYGNTCILNGSVRGRVSSSRKRFWTLPNLYSEVSA